MEGDSQAREIGRSQCLDFSYSVAQGPLAWGPKGGLEALWALLYYGARRIDDHILLLYLRFIQRNGNLGQPRRFGTSVCSSIRLTADQSELVLSLAPVYEQPQDLGSGPTAPHSIKVS